MCSYILFIWIYLSYCVISLSYKNLKFSAKSLIGLLSLSYFFYVLSSLLFIYDNNNFNISSNVLTNVLSNFNNVKLILANKLIAVVVFSKLR